MHPNSKSDKLAEQVVRRASGEGLKASRVEVPTDDEDFDTAMSYTITVQVRNYLGQVHPLLIGRSMETVIKT